MTNIRITAIILIILGVFSGYFVYSSQVKPDGPFGKFPFKLGLDLNGGTHLVYQADTKDTKSEDISGAMNSLRNTIEKRVNAFGVGEPLVQTEQSKVGTTTLHKLVVELPGVEDINTAIALIGKTPVLEFKLENAEYQKTLTASSTNIDPSKLFLNTGLTGKYLERADLQFDQQTGSPTIALTFNPEGKVLFAKLTKDNIGKVLAIFLDGQVLSNPVIRDEIKDGKAVISGSFTPKEAKQLVEDLNYGALPLPISLIASENIGPSLGANAIKTSVFSGFWSFVIIALFLIIWYRLPGLIAVFALAIYVVLNLAIFKLIPVTMTSAGLAGFILSMGMAVDANILIFERMKEELKKGLDLPHAIKEGFARAWTSILDSNLSSIITGVILYYFATSSLVRGFALVLVIGVLVSMFTAVTFSRTLLLAIGIEKTNKFTKFLFGNGFSK